MLEVLESMWEVDPVLICATSAELKYYKTYWFLAFLQQVFNCVVKVTVEYLRSVMKDFPCKYKKHYDYLPTNQSYYSWGVTSHTLSCSWSIYTAVFWRQSLHQPR